MGAGSLGGWSGLRVMVVKHRAAYKEQGRTPKVVARREFQSIR